MSPWYDLRGWLGVNRRLSIYLVKKKANKSAGRDAGTIDRFDLTFQYPIEKVLKKKNGQKQSQIKNTVEMHTA